MKSVRLFSIERTGKNDFYEKGVFAVSRHVKKVRPAAVSAFVENKAPPDIAISPPAGSEAHDFDAGTLHRELERHIGKFVRCQFFAGPRHLSVKQGILESVGFDVLTLYDDTAGARIVCGLYALRFATVYDSDVTPAQFQRRG